MTKQNKWMSQKVIELHNKGIDNGSVAERLAVSRKYVTNVLRKQEPRNEVDA